MAMPLTALLAMTEWAQKPIRKKGGFSSSMSTTVDNLLALSLIDFGGQLIQQRIKIGIGIL